MPPGMCWGGTLCCSRLTAPILSDLYLINTGERLGKVRELHFPSPTLLNWERNFKKKESPLFWISLWLSCFATGHLMLKGTKVLLHSLNCIKLLLWGPISKLSRKSALAWHPQRIITWCAWREMQINKKTNFKIKGEMLPMAFFLLPVSAAQLHTTEQEDTLLEGMLATCLRHLPYIQDVLASHSRDWPHTVYSCGIGSDLAPELTIETLYSDSGGLHVTPWT